MIILVIRVNGCVYDTADGGLSLGICRGDLDFLEAEDVGPFPAAKAGAERGFS